MPHIHNGSNSKKPGTQCTRDQLSRLQERARCNHRYTDTPPRLSPSVPWSAKLSKISSKKRRTRTCGHGSTPERHPCVPWSATPRTMPLPDRCYTFMVTLRALTACTMLTLTSKGSTPEVHGRDVTSQPTSHRQHRFPVNVIAC